jgi:DNA-binding transcriptional MerR regulator
MFGIGDFARYGRVSVRMLRHYDALGLLQPARVDEASGYRYYTAGQLARLNRIIALKDLGFSLRQVKEILEEQVSAEELRGMLRLRQADLEAAIAADTARLAGVAARLRAIESEGRMPAEDVVIKQVPAVRVAELTGRAAELHPTAITPVVRKAFGELVEQMGKADLFPAGPATAYYEPEEDGVVVHASMPISAAPMGEYEFEVVDLPAVEAATLVHRGSMDHVLVSYQALGRWIEEHGYQSAGPVREVTLEWHEDENQWVHELQEPITRARS